MALKRLSAGAGQGKLKYLALHISDVDGHGADQAATLLCTRDFRENKRKKNQLGKCLCHSQFTHYTNNLKIILLSHVRTLFNVKKK